VNLCERKGEIDVVEAEKKGHDILVWIWILGLMDQLFIW
jgi:hypothetical protein